MPPRCQYLAIELMVEFANENVIGAPPNGNGVTWEKDDPRAGSGPADLRTVLVRVVLTAGVPRAPHQRIRHPRRPGSSGELVYVRTIVWDFPAPQVITRSRSPLTCS